MPYINETIYKNLNHFHFENKLMLRGDKVKYLNAAERFYLFKSA